MSSKTKSSRMAINATFFAGVFLLAAGVQAAEPSVHEKTVSYADLDLSRQADVAALYTRLKIVSKDVCGTPDIRDLAMRRLHEACVEEALSDAVEQVGNAALSALHNDSSLRIRVAQRRGLGGSRT